MTASLPVRFEDIAQNGCVVIEALAPGLTATSWPLMRDRPGARELFEQGIVPILTHIVASGEPGPFSIQEPLRATGGYEMAHSVGPDGQVSRLHVNMWVDVQGVVGSTYGPPPEKAGQLQLAGRLYAQHVVTRLFAPPEERKVVRLPNTHGEPEVPPTRCTAVNPVDVMQLPTGAAPLENELRVDEARIAFGLGHTDSNQHVNSWVYPRMFEEAALRRFASLGRRTDVLPRYVECGFRKPSFAGDHVAIALKAFELEGRVGVVGMYLPASEAQSPAAAKPLCTVRMLFE